MSLYYKLVRLASCLPYSWLRTAGRRWGHDPLGGPPGSFWFDADVERYFRRGQQSQARTVRLVRRAASRPLLPRLQVLRVIVAASALAWVGLWFGVAVVLL